MFALSNDVSVQIRTLVHFLTLHCTIFLLRKGEERIMTPNIKESGKDGKYGRKTVRGDIWTVRGFGWTVTN